MSDEQRAKKPRGRPVEYPMPDPIPDTPENIMKAFLGTPPRKRSDWKFAKDREQEQEVRHDSGHP